MRIITLKYILWVVFTLVTIDTNAQNRVISGFVTDQRTGEKLIGATIADTVNKKGVFTDNYGFFSVSVPQNVKTLKISFVGYEALKIDVPKTTVKQIQTYQLKAQNFLEEVIIKSNQERLLGQLTIPIAKLKAIPPLLGEVDILKSLAFIPGVAMGTEGSSSLHVRGGTPDQNLILLDDAPIYNASHFGGFFSVFNPSILKNVDLYKGSFPAQFGGKLSSVIDISTNDGNENKHTSEYTLGLINQNLMLSGPVRTRKNIKSSYILASRYSNFGLFTALSNASNSDSKNSYQFFDINGKWKVDFNPKNQLYFSFFTGRDFVSQRIKETNSQIVSKTNWGNITGTIRYNHVFSPKVFLKTSLIYSNFENTLNSKITQNIENESSQTKQSISKSMVTDVALKTRLDFYPNSKISTYVGNEIIRHVYVPLRLKVNFDIPIDSFQKLNQQIPAFEVATFIENKIKFSQSLTSNVGLRYVNFFVQNKAYQSLEPRVSLQFQPKETTFKLSYAKMQQFIHLLTNNGVGLSNDIWVPATNAVQPQSALQYSTGIERKFFGGKLGLSLEGYYKSLKRLIDYPEGVGYLTNLEGNWEEKIEKNGIGRVLGLEFMATKNTGKLNGWLSYTLSKSDRQFENVNLGRWYPMKYDRRNMLNLTANYTLSKKWSLSGSFVYQTGHAITLPTARLFDGINDYRLLYSGRNQSRIPNYHRMDAGATRTIVTPKGKEKQLNFGVYNLYNRANPYYLDIEVIDWTTNQNTLRQYSLIPFLPYVSYGVKF